MYIYLYISIFIFIYMYIHIYVCIRVHINKHIHTCKPICVFIHFCMCTYVNSFVCIKLMFKCPHISQICSHTQRKIYQELKGFAGVEEESETEKARRLKSNARENCLGPGDMLSDSDKVCVCFMKRV